MTASERRKEILEVLCLRRFEKINNLAFEFGVTERTIRNDILILSLDYPIYTVQGNGGGIYVDEKFRWGNKYLKGEQQELLERLLTGSDCQAKCNTFFKYSLGERNPRHFRGRLLIRETTAFNCS